MPDQLEWRTIDFQGKKLYAAILGMAVAGNETQVLIADEIQVIKDVAWIHDDKTIDWLVGPSKEYKEALENELLKVFWKEAL